MQEAGSLGQVGQEGLGVLQDPEEAGAVGEGGEVGAEEGPGEEVALAEVQAEEDQKEGYGEELGEGGFLALLGLGEAYPLGLEGFELVIDPDVDGYQEGFCVKMVSQPLGYVLGMLAIGSHSIPLFSFPKGANQVVNEGISYSLFERRLIRSL